MGDIVCSRAELAPRFDLKQSSPRAKMAPESRKKSKGTPGSSDAHSYVLPAALTTLLSTLSDLGQAFAAAESPAPGTVLPKLAKTHTALGSLEHALQTAGPTDVASELPRTWQEDLDREGVGLWNRSTAIRCSIGTQASSDEDRSFRKTVAQREWDYLCTPLATHELTSGRLQSVCSPSSSSHSELSSH